MHRLRSAATAALLMLGCVAHAISAGCPQRTVLTTNCSAVCPSPGVCVTYSSSASTRLDRATLTAEWKIEASGCVSHCLRPTVDPQSKILLVHVPGGEPPVEEIAPLTLPANVTRLDLTSDTSVAKTLGFAGDNIVATGTLLTYLGLHFISPETLPAAVFNLPLTTLRLQLNASSLPAATTRFRTISTLILDGGGLTAFPSSQVIGDMPQVRTLSLTANNITEVPVDDWTASLYAASALRELALGENQLTSFGAAFMSLRVLDLHGNRLSTLPTSLTAMPVLSELRLDGNPLDAARLAAQLNESMPLIELKRLNLSACGLLAALPAGFASVFAGLTHLDLTRNGLASVAAGELPDESLEFLNVSANNLTSFSGHFTALRTLDISRNQLSSLAATLPPSLVRLNAASNALVSLNVSVPTGLEELDLSDNKLTVFPSSIVWDAPRLTVLRLTGNPHLAPINVTRDQFDKLQSLVELSVDATVFNSGACRSDWLVMSKHGTSLCVIPGDVGERTEGKQETTTTATTSSSVSNASSRVAGVITTLVFVVAGVVVFRVRRQQRCRQQQQLAFGQLVQSRRLDLVPYRNRDDHDAPTTRQEKPMPMSECDTGCSKATSSTASPSSVHSHMWTDDAITSLRVALDAVRFFKVVGMGAHGQVWRGTCRTSPTESCHVAIKTLSPDLARDRGTVARFLKQLKLQASLHHPRLVAVVGIAWNSPLDLCALLEFMPRGDLFATLHYSSSSSCSSASSLFQPGVWGESKLQIALDILDALLFLHAQSPPVLHRDLKSRNVLLDSHGRAKLSDLGVDSTTAAITSPLWTAPEVILNSRAYTDKADIFSFGVILSELDTHEIPYGYDGSATTMLKSAKRIAVGTPRGEECQERERQLLLRQITFGEIHPAFRTSCPSAIYELAQKCLAPEPSERPSAVELHLLLRRIERDGSDVRRPAFR